MGFLTILKPTEERVMMKIKRKEIEVYVVDDREFTNKLEAKAYEDRLLEGLKYTYYRITYSPDLTEGRGYYKSMIVAVVRMSKKRNLPNELLQYLMNEIGKPIEMVMGVSPIDNWIISEPYDFDNLTSLNKFLNEKVVVGIGDYRKPIIPEVVRINERGLPEGNKR